MEGESLSFGFESRNPDAFIRKWNENSTHCREVILDSDFAEIEGLRLPEDLLVDLKQRADPLRRNHSQITKMLTALETSLIPMEKGVTLLISSMKPEVIDTSDFWFQLYLAVKLCLEQENTRNHMATMFTKTARILQRCAACEYASDSEEFKSNLLSVFVAITRHWANTSNWIRENPDLVRVDSEYFAKSSEATMNEVEEATSTLEHCYSSRIAGRGRLKEAVTAPNDVEGPDINLSNVSFPCRILPLENAEKFIGRADVMQQIHLALSLDNNSRSRHCCLWGLGGVGKTQTALHYAYLYADEYDAIFWIRGASEQSLNENFLKVITHLGLKQPGTTPPDENRNVLHHWLRACKKKWLMIFDNVEDLDHIWESMPTTEGSILITTRHERIASGTNGPPASKIQLKALSEQEGWTMFSDILRTYHSEWKDSSNLAQDEIEAGKALCTKLGGHPLGIRQMARSICDRQSVPVSKFLKWFQKLAEDTTVLSGQRGYKAATDYQYGVETVWSIAFDTIYKKELKDNSDASKLLTTICFFFADEIPAEIFKTAYDGFEFCGAEELFEFGPDKHELLYLALIDNQPKSISVHRLVQNAFLHHVRQDDRQKAFVAACHLLNQIFPYRISLVRPTSPDWPICSRYVPHVKALIERFVQFGSSLTITDDFITLVSNCATYLWETGESHEAAELAKIARDACSDKTTINYTHLENVLGNTAFELGDLSTGHASLENALKIRRQKLPSTHELVLCSMNNYGNYLNHIGDARGALTLYENVRSAREEKIEGQLELLIALTWMGSGQAQLQLSAFELSKAAYDKAWDIVVAANGPRGHYVAHLHYYYGNLELAQGNIDTALEKYRKGLGLYARQRPRHMLTACFYYKVGIIEIVRGNKSEARKNLEKALDISQNLRSEGNVVRVARRLLPLISSGTTVAEKKEKERLTTMVGIWQRYIEKRGISFTTKEEKDKAFDGLVCYYFR